MSWFICGGSSYKEDVNIGQFSFLPVEFKLNGRLLTLLDTNGKFLEEQAQQYESYNNKKNNKESEELKQRQNADFVHPKVQEAIELHKREKEQLQKIEEENKRLRQEYELLTDLIIAQQLD